MCITIYIRVNSKDIVKLPLKAEMDIHTHVTYFEN